MKPCFLYLQELQKTSGHPELMDRAIADLHRASSSSITGGRNITAGYTRGWGLQYDIISAFVAQDPIFIESRELSQSRGIVSIARLMNLFLILKYGMTDLAGDIIEFGAYQGGSSIFMANVARRLGFTGKIYALDTFQGMPLTHETLDIHRRGDFGDASFEDLINYRDKVGLVNLVPIKGLFQETASAILQQAQKIILAHIDCDIYEAVSYATSAVQPYMHPVGGYLVFDDALQSSCLGALQAVEEMIQRDKLRAEQAWPHFIYRYPVLTGIDPASCSL